MSDPEAKTRRVQADNAEALARLLRENDLPLIGWHIDSAEGRVEGQIYREDARAIRADLAAVAAILGADMSETPQDEHQTLGAAQLVVQGHYRGVPVTVYGHLEGRAAE